MGGVHPHGFPLSLAAISLVTTGLLRVLPAGSLHSPYVQWGWRIPFFLGALLAGGVFLYYVKKVQESSVWAEAEKTKSPLKELFRGENFRCLSQVFLVMSGAWFTLNTVTSILPGVLLTVRQVNSVVVTTHSYSPIACWLFPLWGEQVHIATYPPVRPFHRPGGGPQNYNLSEIRICSAAHAFEGKVFNVVAARALDIDAIEQLSQGDSKMKELLESAPAPVSRIVGPNGELLADPLVAKRGHGGG